MNALLTINNLELWERDATPVGDINPQQGSLALMGTNGDVYVKTGATNADWTQIYKLPQLVTPGSYPHTAANWTAVLVDSSATRTVNLPDPASTAIIEIVDATGTSDIYPITFARYGSESIEGYAGNHKVAWPFGRWLIRSDGTNWRIVSRPRGLVWRPTIISGSITATTSATNMNAIYRGEVCPESGNYYIQFDFDIGTVSGTPTDLIFYTNSSVALDRISRSGTHTTLIAGATEICRWAKGSTLASGDSNIARSSSSYYIDAGERVGIAGAGSLCFAAVGSSTSAAFASTLSMVRAC